MMSLRCFVVRFFVVVFRSLGVSITVVVIGEPVVVQIHTFMLQSRERARSRLFARSFSRFER